jgi:RNA polymerase sigma factor (sigma-70 family)
MGESAPASFEEQLEDLYRERRGELHAVASRAGGGEAADLVQEACLKIVEASRQGEIRSPMHMLFRIARNAVTDRLRARGRAARLFQPPPANLDAADDRPDVEHAMIVSERLRRALAVIDAMPPKRREVFLLHRLEGLSYSQIARRSGVSIKTVEKHMSAAMAQLSRGVDAENHPSDTGRSGA